VFVADASAILSGKDISGLELYTTPSVLDEVRVGKRARLLGYMLEANLRVQPPQLGSIAAVRKKMDEMGDRVSKVDIEVLALALDLKAVLLCDDYSMQNIASELSIPFRPLSQRGIKRVVKYRYRCSGCGRFVKSEGDCPFCGSPVRRLKDVTH